MASLSYEPAKGELEDMIWEVDENMSKSLSYQEFSIMYRRVRMDAAGVEPRKLYTLADFMMNDKNGDCKVAMDEAVQLMFMRYGKSFSQDEIKSLFKDTADKSGTISFREFRDYVERQHDALEKKREDAKLKSMKGRPKGKTFE
mmetsp:Transcript_23240/g.52187  ORF Transcript_23240/g.52187 Transcript_23240/m.52187 type:complete len:144 (-) Transcript_23240:22-453(-)